MIFSAEKVILPDKTEAFYLDGCLVEVGRRITRGSNLEVISNNIEDHCNSVMFLSEEQKSLLVFTGEVRKISLIVHPYQMR